MMRKNKRKNKIIIFILGIMCFFISQILLRIPILNTLNYIFSLEFLMRYGVLISILTLISAGLFEEGFRFIFREFILWDQSEDERGLIAFENKISDAIIFGLGHGLCEAVYVIILAFVSSPNFPGLLNIFLILFERILAVIFHIAMTIIVFRGFKIGKKYAYILFAIGLHTIFNLPILFRQTIGLVGIYIIMLILDLSLVIYIGMTRLNLKEDY